MPLNSSERDYVQSLNVSRETIDKLEIYLKLLFKWQKAINLVSPKTVQDSWQRHFVDSAQLLPLIPNNVRTIADIGSGAGFPGLVLAILNPSLQIHLIESDAKKCQFMKSVSRETGISNAYIHTERIERAYHLVTPDMVSARALASLTELLDYAYPWIEGNSKLSMLLLKGERAGDEIAQAEQKYQFYYEIFDSDTNDEASILRLSNVRICA